jgi:type I restriction enzyme S subunit
MLPEGWNTYNLSELITLIGGGTPKTEVAEYWNGKIPWLSVVDFNSGNKHVFETEKSITEKGLQESATKILKEGQIIISARGTVGEMAMLGRDMAFNQSCYGIDSNKKTNNEFLFYLLKSSIQRLKKKTHGAVFDTITKQTFENISVNIPVDLSEQSRIASILSSLDDKIEVNLRMNKTLEAIAQAIFKEWFVDFRFPGFDGELVDVVNADGSVSRLPKGWRKGRIDEFISFHKGVSYRSDELQSSSNALVTLGSFNRGGGFNENGFKEYIGKYNNDQKLIEGDVVIAQTDITQNAEVIGSPAIVENTFLYNALIPSIDVIKCSPKNEIFNSNIIYYFLQNRSFKNYCLSHTNGSTVLHLRSSCLPNYEIIIPDSKILSVFKDKITAIRDKIRLSRKENYTLKTIRNILLPKLITGKIRVT